MKSEVLVLREEIDPLSKAWMKELRSHNRTKKSYDVNPYAEVYQFRKHVYGILTDSADGMGAPWMYLIEGEDTAMLIDTGFGIGNLKGLIREIIGEKTLVVVNTHAHVDHCYGNFQFEKVYCHEFEAPYLEAKRNPHVWDYLFDEKGKNRWCWFDKSDIIPFKNYEIVPCPEGHRFKLGKDHEVELIFLGGHSAGHAAYLDHKERILFCGDDFLSMRVGLSGPKEGMPYGEYATIPAFLREVEKLAGRVSEFDALFPGHFILDIDSRAVFAMRDTLRRVVKNPEQFDYEQMNHKGIMTRLCYVNGLGTLAYNKKSAAAWKEDVE